MTAYAIAHLHTVEMNQDIVKYLEEIDATLEPFGGYFIIHGGEPTVAEGDYTGALIVIAFPDKDAVANWYASEAYQAILPLRTNNSTGWAIMLEGVDRDHAATDILDPAAQAQ